MKQRLARWLPARHLATNCLYLELFILFSSACSKQSKQYCRVFEQKRYFSIHLKPYGHTPQLYSTCAPHTLYTCSDIRTHRMHTPCVLYTTPARTVRASQNLVLTILGFSQIETIARINMQKLCTFETADTKQTHQQTAHSAHCLHNNVSSNWSIRIKMQNTEKFPWQWKKDHGHPRSPTCIGKIIILIKKIKATRMET